MARSNITDYLQVFPFWMMDMAPLEQSALPVFTPLFGFSEITAPEVQLDTIPIPEGNALFTRKIVKRGNVSSMTIRRASTFIDADFWRWTMSAISGNTSISNTDLGNFQFQTGGSSYRRDLVLIHFFSRLPTSVAESTIGNILSASLSSNQIVSTAATTLSGFGIGPQDVAPRLPAKAWILYGCVPSRYKAGSDFNAAGSEVSISELTIEVERIEEVSLAA